MNLVAMIITFTLGASTGSAKSPLGDRCVERHIGHCGPIPCCHSHYKITAMTSDILKAL